MGIPPLGATLIKQRNGLAGCMLETRGAHWEATGVLRTNSCWTRKEHLSRSESISDQTDPIRLIFYGTCNVRCTHQWPLRQRDGRVRHAACNRHQWQSVCASLRPCSSADLCDTLRRTEMLRLENIRTGLKAPHYRRLTTWAAGHCCRAACARPHGRAAWSAMSTDNHGGESCTQ